VRLARVFALCMLPALLLFACGEDEEEGYSEPHGLAVSSYHPAGGMVTITWVAASGSFLGYRVYAGDYPLASLGASDIEDELVATLGSVTTECNLSLPSDQYYYVHVRAYTEDDDKASNEIYIIARPEGTTTLYEFDSRAPNASGFDMSTGEVVSMALTNLERHEKVDFWIGYSAVTQYTGGDELYFWNPKDAAPEYVNTGSFQLLGTAAFETYRTVSQTAQWLSSVQVAPNAVYAVRVADPAGRTYYGKIMAEGDPAGVYPDRTVSVRWAYQPEPGVPWFSSGG
jgi:hypothetical protein